MPPARRPTRARVAVVLVSALTLVLALTLPGGAPDGSGASTPPARADRSAVTAALAAPPPGSALAQLASLEVAPALPGEAYDRTAFGTPWTDVDGNGCDTRNDVLARDLVSARGEGSSCVLLAGTLHDPYSGEALVFERGATSSSAVQVDHVVALSDAWRSGASRWPRARRVAFANDPLNLLAVDGALNEEKSGSDAAGWLPPEPGYRCPYVARQVAVKTRYGLQVTATERSAMVAALQRCG